MTFIFSHGSAVSAGRSVRTEVWPSAAPAHGRLSSLTKSCPPTGPASHPASGLRPQLGPDPPWGPFRQPGLPHNVVAEIQKDILREPGLCPSWLALEVSHAGGSPQIPQSFKGKGTEAISWHTEQQGSGREYGSTNTVVTFLENPISRGYILDMELFHDRYGHF